VRDLAEHAGAESAISHGIDDSPDGGGLFQVERFKFFELQEKGRLFLGYLVLRNTAILARQFSADDAVQSSRFLDSPLRLWIRR
jgi:hypothetical protein